MINSTTLPIQMNDAPKRMIAAAICAYSVDLHRPFHPPCKYWNKIGIDPKQKTCTFTAGSDGVDAGFVGFTTDDWVVISLRGTLSTYYSWQSFCAFLEDWWQDDETKPVEFKVGSKSLGHVEKGFLKALTALWPHIQSAIKDVDWSKKKGVQITGHSKGAGMTFLLAALLKEYCPTIPNIGVHAFAAPLSGQPDFAKHYTSVGLDKTSMRYQRASDLVPFVPPSKDWNIFENIYAWSNDEFHWLAATLELLGDTVYGGYEEMGAMTFLPDPASKAPPQTGAEAVKNARIEMVKAIEAGETEKIAAAHLAETSYWPAIHQTTVNLEDMVICKPQTC